MQWDIGWLLTPAPSSMKLLPSLAVYNPHCIPDEIHHQYIAAGVEGTEKQQKRLHNFIMQECVHFGHKCWDKQIFKMEEENQGLEHNFLVPIIT